MKEAKNKTASLSRRRFLKNSAATGIGLMFIPAASVYGTPANDSLGLGVIGCGGRGTYDAGIFLQNTTTRLTALYDLFDDRLSSFKDRFDKMGAEKGHSAIQAANMFKGARGFEKLVQSKDVDYVLITSPPYFHPEHFEAAVAAGKHVYLEKPVSSDVAGALRVIKAGQKANGKLSMHVGFQKRYDVGYKTVIEKIHAGEIGEIVLGQTYYYTNDLDRREKEGLSSLENRLRNWVFDKALSGDIIVEQNIHILDIVNWAMKAHPIKATGTAGKALRKEVAGIPADMLCSDHFILTYTYPGDVHISFNSNQFKNKGYRQSGERFFGSLGVADTLQSGPAKIISNKDQGIVTYDGPVDLHQANITKQQAMIEGIKAGKFDNQTEQGSDTTLTMILGRMAAYSGKEVTWDQMIKSQQNWNLKLNLDGVGNSAVSMK
jgi:myo-inositol 2-dehydrogenase / D-chiro-inositol 1-dehydrogenase